MGKSLPYTVHGVVRHGDKRGRVLGFPTANLLGVGPEEILFGVYASHTSIGGEAPKTYRSVTSFGTRPTFEGNETRLETHIFDFDEDIYGQEIVVQLTDFIRAEEKFDTVDALIAAMQRDVEKVTAVFTSAQTASPGISS
jgi:riboflavin kinase/FMN adenylyltransferase